MKNLLAVIGDGSAGPVLEAALLVARRFNSHIVGLHSLTTEYAVVFGGEMGFSISSEEIENPISPPDRKSTRLNSSHVEISYAVFCLKKKKKTQTKTDNRRT